MQASQTTENQRKFQDRHLVLDRLKLRESKYKFKTWCYKKYINSLTWYNFTPQPADSPFTTLLSALHITLWNTVFIMWPKDT